MNSSALNVEHVRPSQVLLQYLCALDILDEGRVESRETAQNGRLARDPE